MTIDDSWLAINNQRSLFILMLKCVYNEAMVIFAMIIPEGQIEVNEVMRLDKCYLIKLMRSLIRFGFTIVPVRSACTTLQFNLISLEDARVIFNL